MTFLGLETSKSLKYFLNYTQRDQIWDWEGARCMPLLSWVAWQLPHSPSQGIAELQGCRTQMQGALTLWHKEQDPVGPGGAGVLAVLTSLSCSRRRRVRLRTMWRLRRYRPMPRPTTTRHRSPPTTPAAIDGILELQHSRARRKRKRLLGVRL